MTLYEQLHLLFNDLPRLTYPFEEGADKNGIYLFFEKREKFRGMDRIVKVGSHTGKDRLFRRLMEHFRSHHRQSIFRGHIGRCLLLKEGKEEYLPIWNCDVKSRIGKQLNKDRVNWAMEEEMEERISEYLQLNFSFVLVTGLKNKAERKRLCAGIIATLAQAEERCCSKGWLGLQHNNQKIRESKLWNVNFLKASVLTAEELIELSEQLKESP